MAAASCTIAKRERQNIGEGDLAQEALEALMAGFSATDLAFLERVRAVEASGLGRWSLEEVISPVARATEFRAVEPGQDPRRVLRFGDPDDAAVLIGLSDAGDFEPLESDSPLVTYFPMRKERSGTGIRVHAPFSLGDDRDALHGSADAQAANARLLTRAPCVSISVRQSTTPSLRNRAVKDYTDGSSLYAHNAAAHRSA